MKKQLTIAVLLAASLALTACAKQESTPEAEAESSAAVADQAVTPEQQAAIDAIDQPILDEKNTDIPAEVANAPADEATADESVAATSEPVAP
ncbi:hypothetical protein QUG64_03655 [Acinetobacter lwoffii]|jgi:hypothetical protein|uniref:Internalin n=2 Tax=Acinetobacter lwoffii TaxID=28090 RepID=A0A2K8URY0_ACILW|nr:MULTISPECIES: hypothetical protein [Pseudomonadota]AUC08017.1 hypothetical protein BVG18_14545 [Acinetobacter lwoffii]ENU16590.1 hypothetical protein F995_02075 [Acinetobacter sp. CIP A162]ENW24579.1 hypothetical protein F924_03201 [Acinetobacter lwoffii ATCC 9957 = CIP 70.31]ENX28098.1 hypothetical protein F891_01727 [Acinetobacter sp. CIP 101966]ENX30001.1 hypothetical protein F890_01892 [Acinetobacter sp. CIP 64.7]